MENRLRSLDGLRGCAAVVVLIHHLVLLSPLYATTPSNMLASGFWSNLISIFKGTPLRLLISGQAAVIVFFVLSGFVLALTLERVERWQYKPYIIKRVVRIYVPFAAATIMAAILWSTLKPVASPIVSNWYNSDWPSHTLTATSLLHHLGMTGSEIWLNNPMWSLIHELRISIIFPAIAWSVRRRMRISLIGYGVLFLAGNVGLHLVNDAFAASLIGTVRVVFLFAIGAALYFNLEHVRSAISRMPMSFRIAALCFGAICLMAPEAPLYSPIPLVGAVILVTMTAADTTLRTALESSLALWLGRISYSLYLTHVIVIMAMVSLFAGHLSYPALCLISIVASLLVAYVMHIVIERPSMYLGRALAKFASSQTL